MKRIHRAVVGLALILSILACERSSQVVPITQTPAALPSPPHPTDTVVSMPSVQPVATAMPMPAPVPAEFQGMYDQLNAALETVQNEYSTQQSGPAPIFAAELSYANGNTGEGLLSPGIIDLVRLQLDEFYKMGVRGVVVAIKFPMLEPDFPRSAEYLQFFKQVTAEVRLHNMKLLVESGALFYGTAFSPLHVDWSKYASIQAFRDAEIHQLQTIASEIKPDYLQISNEPTTTAMLTHFSDSTTDYAAFVRQAVAAIPPQPGMLVGAGAGTWENQAYVTGLFNIAGLDFIDLHVYPLGANGGMLSLAADLAKQAHAAGKRVVISEAWLYKTTSASAYQAADFTFVIGRDVFSFWEPLDEKFIQDLTAVSRTGGIEFVSFFWVREFYAYLDYDQYKSIPADQINPVIDKFSVANSRQDVFSPLGVFFENWISQSK